MRFVLVLAWLLLGVSGSAVAQVSIEIGLPSVRVGINLGGYPDLVPVPDYPVYYAPQVSANIFFYDGLYWVYSQDRWYASSWYDGPWDMVAPEFVPYFVLRIPVRYYRQPPMYFRGWQPDAPPRWGEHWGHDWEQHHGGWDRWDRRSAPPPAPLPTYQREYSGNRYPSVDQQRALRDNNYHYRPREAVVRQTFDRPHAPAAPAQRAQPNDRPAASAPPPSARRDAVPSGAARAPAAARPESRPPPQAPAAEARRAPPDRDSARQQTEARTARPQPRETRQPASPGGEQPQAQHGSAPRESPAPRAREPAERPRDNPPRREQQNAPQREPKNEPQREQKQEPERERDH